MSNGKERERETNDMKWNEKGNGNDHNLFGQIFTTVELLKI